MNQDSVHDVILMDMCCRFEYRLALAGLQEETERRIALEKEKNSFFKQRDKDKRERQQV